MKCGRSRSCYAKIAAKAEALAWSLALQLPEYTTYYVYVCGQASIALTLSHITVSWAGAYGLMCITAAWRFAARSYGWAESWDITHWVTSLTLGLVLTLLNMQLKVSFPRTYTNTLL